MPNPSKAPIPGRSETPQPQLAVGAGVIAASGKTEASATPASTSSVHSLAPAAMQIETMLLDPLVAPLASTTIIVSAPAAIKST